MRKLWVTINARYERLRDWALGRPRIGQAARSYDRYYDLGMQHVAGSITYFGVLTLFPFLGLLYATAAAVATNNPEVQAKVNEAVDDGLGVSVDVGASFLSAQAAASIRAVIATLGVTGVVYAGRLWVDAYRRALHIIWPADPKHTNFVWRYVRDILVLLLFVSATAVLIAAALAATGGPYKLLAAHGHGLSNWASIPLRLVAVVAAVAWGTFMCDRLYRRIGGAPRGRPILEAAFLAGLCLAALAIGGLLLARHAFADPIFGIVVTMLGLMLWVSAAVRITLSLAVWAAQPAAHSAR